MPGAFPRLAEEAMKLSPPEKFALAGMLLEENDSEDDVSKAEAAWEEEIADRIRAIDEGRVTGVSLEDVMREADQLLPP